MDNNSSKPDYIEFSDPRLVAIYNTVNAINGYRDFYIELAKKLSAKTIIDVGCGSGLLTCELAKHGHQMIGIEPSKEMLNLAKQSECGNEVEWIQGDALSLNEFNVDLTIMTGHVAQFYVDDDYWEKALESINRSLKPGGYLAFESRNPAMQPWARNSQHIDWPSKDSPREVTDSIFGNIKWWMQLLEVKGEKVLYENHYLFKNSGEEFVSINELKFRTKEEVTQSLEKAGFTMENIYGDWDSSPVNTESPEFIFVAKENK